MSIERGSLLMQTGRHEMAEREFREVLVSEPNNALAHAMVAICLVEQKKYAEATDEAQRAIADRPDWDVGYSAMASVLYARERLKEAVVATEQAIGLDPFDPAHRAMLANIRIRQRQWPAALAAADEGLAIDPEHPVCVNARGVALVNLGRRDEANITIGGALQRNPLNSTTHANQGWALLHAGDHKAALEHFRESLRLNPDSQWARAGIVEALKARNIIYRLMLKYFLFMSRLGRQARWGILIGAYFGFQFLNQASDKDPAIKPFAMPVLIAYYVFAYMTWLAGPLFNLMLRLDRYGRYALSRDQRVSSNWVGLALLGGAGFAVTSLMKHDSAYLLIALIVAVMSIPLSAIFNCAEGWPRWCMAGYTGLLGCIAGAIAVQVLVYPDRNDSINLVNVYVVGLIATSFIANALATASVRR